MIPLYFLSFISAYNSLGLSEIPIHEPFTNTLTFPYNSDEDFTSSICIINGFTYSLNGLLFVGIVI